MTCFNRFHLTEKERERERGGGVKKKEGEKIRERERDKLSVVDITRQCPGPRLFFNQISLRACNL